MFAREKELRPRSIAVKGVRSPQGTHWDGGWAARAISEVLSKVNSLWTSFQLVIALRSPYAILETGLRMRPPEKRRDSAPNLF